jgi:hypothetical protein
MLCEINVKECCSNSCSPGPTLLSGRIHQALWPADAIAVETEVAQPTKHVHSPRSPGGGAPKPGRAMAAAATARQIAASSISRLNICANSGGGGGGRSNNNNCAPDSIALGTHLRAK